MGKVMESHGIWNLKSINPDIVDNIFSLFAFVFKYFASVNLDPFWIL